MLGYCRPVRPQKGDSGIYVIEGVMLLIARRQIRNFIARGTNIRSRKEQEEN